MPELKEISELERFYYEAKRIRDEWDLLIRDLGTAISTNAPKEPMTKELINPLTGKPFIRKKNQRRVSKCNTVQ